MVHYQLYWLLVSKSDMKETYSRWGIVISCGLISLSCTSSKPGDDDDALRDGIQTNPSLCVLLTANTSHCELSPLTLGVPSVSNILRNTSLYYRAEIVSSQLSGICIYNARHSFIVYNPCYMIFLIRIPYSDIADYNTEWSGWIGRSYNIHKCIFTGVGLNNFFLWW